MIPRILLGLVVALAAGAQTTSDLARFERERRELRRQYVEAHQDGDMARKREIVERLRRLDYQATERTEEDLPVAPVVPFERAAEQVGGLGDGDPAIAPDTPTLGLGAEASRKTPASDRASEQGAPPLVTIGATSPVDEDGAQASYDPRSGQASPSADRVTVARGQGVVFEVDPAHSRQTLSLRRLGRSTPVEIADGSVLATDDLAPGLHDLVAPSGHRLFQILVTARLEAIELIHPGGNPRVDGERRHAVLSPERFDRARVRALVSPEGSPWLLEVLEQGKGAGPSKRIDGPETGLAHLLPAGRTSTLGRWTLRARTSPREKPLEITIEVTRTGRTVAWFIEELRRTADEANRIRHRRDRTTDEVEQLLERLEGLRQWIGEAASAANFRQVFGGAPHTTRQLAGAFVGEGILSRAPVRGGPKLGLPGQIDSLHRYARTGQYGGGQHDKAIELAETSRFALQALNGEITVEEMEKAYGLR